MAKNSLQNQESLLAKVYIVETGTKTKIEDVYEVLKARAAEGLSLDKDPVAVKRLRDGAEGDAGIGGDCAAAIHRGAG